MNYVVLWIGNDGALGRTIMCDQNQESVTEQAFDLMKENGHDVDEFRHMTPKKKRKFGQQMFELGHWDVPGTDGMSGIRIGALEECGICLG